MAYIQTFAFSIFLQAMITRFIEEGRKSTRYVLHGAYPQTSKFQRVASLQAPPSRRHIICPPLLLWFQWTTRPLIQYHMYLAQLLCYYP
jgi:hypothetical protein